MQVPHPPPRPAPIRQEAIAVDDDVMQHRAGHLVNAAPGPADARIVWWRRHPFRSHVHGSFSRAVLLARQPVEYQRRGIGADRLDDDPASVAADQRRAQFQIPACLSDPVELPDLPCVPGGARLALIG